MTNRIGCFKFNPDSTLVVAVGRSINAGEEKTPIETIGALKEENTMRITIISE
jgi:hypothetical protein